MKQALVYSLKVWLTTVVLGMRVTTLVKIATDTYPRIYHASDIISSAMYDIPVGFVACLPSWLLFAALVRYVNKEHFSVRVKKIQLTFGALLLSLLPFALLFWPQLTHLNYLPDMLPMLIGYAAVTIASLWLYKLPAISKEPNTVNYLKFDQ